MSVFRMIAAAAALILATVPACAQAPKAQAPATADTQVFQLPEGARVHDVAPAPDGTIWYTAQRQGALGILDPKTGRIRHVPLGERSEERRVGKECRSRW